MKQGLTFMAGLALLIMWVSMLIGIVIVLVTGVVITSFESTYYFPIICGVFFASTAVYTMKEKK